MNNCKHPIVSCVNPYEIIRKYKCETCGGVMMCSCEKDFALRYFPHQIDTSTELKTQIEIPVTLGFQKNICNKCRGKNEEAYPKAPHYGRTSKIHRYYWREILFETVRRFGKWAEENVPEGWLTASHKYRDKYELIEKEVIKELKELHKKNPVYVYDEKSQNEIITTYNVEVLKFYCTYLKNEGERSKIIFNNKILSPEDYVASQYEKNGYKVIRCESRPIHVIFGVFMYLLIQDYVDPKVRSVAFGDREAFNKGIKGASIWTQLPEDFGSSGYYFRRKKEVEEHLEDIPENRSDRIWLFDFWLPYSSDFRQYLWAHGQKDVMIANELVKIIPPIKIKRILKYLIADYWDRYLGWPDLFIYSGLEYGFVEVKSSNDKLSENQKAWIQGNSMELKLPFKLVKLHKNPPIRKAKKKL